MREFTDKFYNVLLFAPVFSFALAQILKYFVYAVRFHVFRKERLTGAGGMPSSHSSGVCTLAVIAARLPESAGGGFKSPIFAVSAILALIVMYDATGVRRAAGLHAKELNKLRKENEIENESGNAGEDKDPKPVKDLKEFLGHTPAEVICGAILGIVIGLLFKV